MKNLNDMFLFAKVVEAGSFSAAARALGQQTSRLSRRVAELERELGVRLLNRNTRNLVPTEVGRGFLRHCQSLVAEAELAFESVEHIRREPSGLVRLSCPPQVLLHPVGEILTRFMVQHPQVRVHVEATGRRVNVIEEGFDIALRVRLPPLVDSDLVMRQLATSTVIMVGAPQLFEGRRLPATLTEIADLPTVADIRAGDLHAWEFIGPDGAKVMHRHRPTLVVDDFPMLRRAAVAGLGIACLPEMIVREDLAGGRLLAVLPTYTLPQGIVHAAFPSRRGMVPAVRALLDALSTGFSLG